MVWADVSVLYPHDYVLTRKRRMVRATESKVHYLVNRSIRDVHKALESAGKAANYLDFRARVVECLCNEYGFLYVTSSTRVIIHEEAEDLIERSMPLVEPADLAASEPAQS